MIDDARTIAGQSNVAVVFLGPPVEGESSGPRPDLSLPEGHLELLQETVASGTPTVAVMICGSPLSSEWMKENVPGILTAWYPGMEGGNAIADVLFGDYSPSGKLPFTWARQDSEPVYYNHCGEITYDESVYLWPFGYGISYTEFDYSNIVVSPEVTDGENIKISFDITNTGERAGSETGQVYICDLERAGETPPVKQLAGFRKLALGPGEAATAEIELTMYQFSHYNPDMERIVEEGEFEIMVGSSSRYLYN